MTDTILVTGASRGIGRATALRLAHDGFDIVLHYRSREQDAERVAEEIRALGREARLLCFDVADRDQARTLLEADIEAHGTYFGVVCNAGITADNPFPALTGDDWDSVVHTNLDGFYNVLHPLVMPMIRRRKPGRIVTIASMSGLIGNRGQVNYSAAKAGIIGATKALAIELAKRHITVNCVAPGWIDTDMTHHLSQEEVLKLIPMRRTGQAEDIAGVVSFLCSKDAAYMTRQVLPVNGGMC
ncbi:MULTISPECIES: 3-oxoacyl-ACP reductase FabG [Chromohalobacter]|uniref:3-oxoacyl-ACP reductase FabG n=1 Tax=Chromohalobacter canadensis TaxID=141389 RepID=A0ABZ0YD13_9GAMM|nr:MULTISPECIES: 3-oxoacyl-ACP reductase FabG [Chromohalobacter]MCK0767423.1 3-oxoacyl-ACP reductase FabG [Chromohalobacter canadensis]MCT8468501.1 3-oxoacyl-ACP reductase FabG [Chromohalobacter canadensis]MCT8471556.1 3-oxoacyl-ACP reductase FabG [Chromohalobacter canadensis]MCT8499009.1 3-oxoacyl-ACP reductase FabG [Chromohalobacter canadensis]WQH09973.1 3-oxoacyl-ACP reductase FabG [Chromohalobacter canadensis]